MTPKFNPLFEYAPKTAPRSRDEIVLNLHICREYWERTIADFLTRPLAELESEIVDDAVDWQTAAIAEALAFGKLNPASPPIDITWFTSSPATWTKRSLRQATAVDLASIAAHLCSDRGKLNPERAVQKAYDLLEEAYRFADRLKATPKGPDNLQAGRLHGRQFIDVELVLSGTSQPNAMPILVPRISTPAALREAVRRIDDTWFRLRRLDLIRGLISVPLVLELRKRRFVAFHLGQSGRAKTRHPKKGLTASTTPRTSGHGWAPPGA